MNNRGTIGDIGVLDHRDRNVAEAIVDLQRLAYRAEADRIRFPDLPPLLQSSRDIRVSDERFVGIHSTARLAGLIAFVEARDKVLVSRLCVHPDHTRQGIASRLLRHVMDQGATRISVTTAEANHPAIALYSGLGFIPEKRFVSPEGLPLVTLGRACVGS